MMAFVGSCYSFPDHDVMYFGGPGYTMSAGLGMTSLLGWGVRGWGSGDGFGRKSAVIPKAFRTRALHLQAIASLDGLNPSVKL